MEHLKYFLLGVFPLFDGLDVGVFLWKALAFAVCWYTNSIKPLKYIWSVLFVVALVPAIGLMESGPATDWLALMVRFYLSWMCAEVAFQSASVEPEERIHAWWTLPLALIFLL